MHKLSGTQFMLRDYDPVLQSHICDSYHICGWSCAPVIYSGGVPVN